MIIYTPEYIPTSALQTVFGLSPNWFLGLKKDGILLEGVHYFYPFNKLVKSNSTKRAMVWK
ncbi:MAG: hypothetical protein AB7D29_10505, partial [Campylobacterales bacterium]